MSLDFYVLDVNRGLSIIVITPNKYAILIDCGCSSEVNPVDWIKVINKLQPLNCRNDNLVLTYMIISHPHSDHITAIERVHNECKPSIILRRKDLDWDKVRNSNTENTSLDYYLRHFFPPNDYSRTVPSEEMPDWGDGMTIKSFELPISVVGSISKSDSSYVNNSSKVIIIKYKGYTFAIGGDIESEALTTLLNTDTELSGLISGNDTSGGVHFFVCPHHGHTSGFCSRWFELAGATKKFNIVSERVKGENEDSSQTAIDTRYSTPQYSLAGNNEGKRMVSTKVNGSILISIDDEGKWSWEAIS